VFITKYKTNSNIMDNLLTIKTTANMKNLRILILCIAVTMITFSQIQAQYSLTALSGTFTPLSGGTPVPAIQTTNAYTVISLGFFFGYNGDGFNKIQVYTNGFINFEQVTSYGGGSILSGLQTCIAPLDDQLSGIGGQASYKTEGTGSNHVFTMEWLNWKWGLNASQAGISFQVKLYETTNRIEFIYRQEAGATVSPHGCIGLAFQRGKYIGLTNTGSNPSVSSIVETVITTKPATGQIYRFDEVRSPKSDNHVTNFSSIIPGCVGVKWTDAIGTNLPSRYLIKVSSVSFAAITNPSDGYEETQDLNLNDGTGSVYIDYGKQKFTGWTDSIGNNTYYIKIFPVSNYHAYTKYKTDGTVPQITIATPIYQARSLTFSNIYSTSINLKWAGDININRVVFAKENGTGTATPSNNTTYTANSFYGTGSQISSSGWYCVYNGTANTVNVTGLKSLTNYAFHVLEYTGTTGSEQYSTVNVTSAHAIQSTNLFTEQTGILLEGVYSASFAWGDYDNDGHLDILLIGTTGANPISKVYRNNGNNTFTEQTGIALTSVSDGSTAWGDYDNDGYLDILLTGYSGTSYISKIYRNNGNNTFTEQTGISLPGIRFGSVAWGDYDNDGYLDILLTGSTGSGNISKIYRNNGNGTFTEQTSISLTGVYYGSVAWGDYDNDGYLDILLTGGASAGYISKIYRNNGNGTFAEQSGISLTVVTQSSVAWGDYDNDGFLDILIAGTTNNSAEITKIYRNNGNGSFTEQTGISLTGVWSGSASWGDYDNDGDLDILLTGNIDYSYIIKIYQNNGNNTFTEQKNILLTALSSCSAAWGDYDNDGDLDILLTGWTGALGASKIYRNDISTHNTAPATPTGLTSNISTNAILRWNPVKNDATPAKGLTYNVRVGKTTGASDVVSPMALNSGYRKIVRMGNTQTDSTFILQNLKKGTYYWSVQAVDNSFAGSVFAPEQIFTYNVDYQASILTFNSSSSSSVKCSWKRGNGDNCVVFAKESGTGMAGPVNNIAYTGNKVFGAGTQIGTTGWYCVYNGNLDTATITNLKTNIEYRFQIIEYTGGSGAEIYYTTVGSGNPAQYIPPFTEQAQISVTGISGNVQAWSDYNNDGYLDLLIAGNDGSSSIVKLYKNNGNNTFTEVTATFSIGTAYDATWCDYDNDGDMDILIAGLPNSKLYKNNGDGTFTLTPLLPDVYMGKSAWADFDNDGYKDIILTGSSGTKILKNNQDGTFISQIVSIPSLSNYSSVACGDYDNDGDLDILVAGYNSGSSAEVTKVYRNDGNFIFTEQTGIILPGVSNCSVAWADMDNDGDLDIVLTGSGIDVYTKIFDNNGNNTFTEIAGTSLKALYRSALAIADYDNDGYRDLIVSGSSNGSDFYTVVYHNNGNKTYTESATLSFPGLQFGSISLGDLDKDGDLDLFLCGLSATGRISKIFKSNLNTINTAPSAPSGLTATLIKNDVKFTWAKATDDKTGSNGLSYNLYLYDVSKTGYKESPSAFVQTSASNGLRLLSSEGDMQYSSNGYTIKGLPAGTYKWSIQAIDAGLKGGAFAAEISFTIADLSNVTVDVSNSLLTNTSSSMQYSINSTNGTNGTWGYCYVNNTNVNFNTGGFDVWVRQTNNQTNTRKVATIASQTIAPAYTIDYINETTGQTVAATDEFSIYSSMSGPISGTDNKATVTPGQSLYFRTKATTNSVASAIQTLTVPVRPSVPTFSIDFANERTSQVVPSTVEYSTSLNMIGANSGSDATVTLVPGQYMYFRKKANVTVFKSGIQTLISPARPAAPAITSDYANETTAQTISSSYEYSTNSDMSNSNLGLGTKVAIVPSQNLYFRTIATASIYKSNVQTLVIPARPIAPSNFVINDIANTFNWTYTYGYSTTSDYEYSTNSGSTWLTCSTKPTNVGNINIANGVLQLRIKATASRFNGDILISNAAFSINTSITNLEEIGIKIYPNPVSETLILEGLKNQSKISICDIHGKLINVLEVQDNTERIDVSNLPRGMYFLKVETSGKLAESKFIKQ
jgi:hypothetical protein